MKELFSINVAKFYGACFQDHKNFLLIEYSSRGTLKEFLSEKQPPLKNMELSLLRDLMTVT